MNDLLQKTRMINELLQKENTIQEEKELPYLQMAQVLSDIMECNTYILSKDGELLGYSVVHDFNNERINKMISNHQFPHSYTTLLKDIQQTVENIPIEEELTTFPFELKAELTNAYTTLVPIFGAGARLGTILLGRINKKFNTEDFILCEYSATVVGMQMLYQKSGDIEKQVRETSMVQMALKSLSFSELKAIKAIFEELDGDEGILTTSSVADRIGITRSVIVNALRKLESGGVIETRSLGMKGTFIKITNQQLIDLLDKETVV